MNDQDALLFSQHRGLWAPIIEVGHSNVASSFPHPIIALIIMDSHANYKKRKLHGKQCLARARVKPCGLECSAA